VDTYKGVASFAWRTLALPLITRDFVDYLIKQRIHIVLCTMMHPWNSWVVQFLPSSTCRYIVTVHDALPHPGDEHFGWVRMLRNNIQCADGVVVLSEYVHNKLVKHYSYPSRRIWQIPHGPFKFDQLLRKVLPIARPRRLLFFGRLRPYKGLSLLLDAFEQIAEQYDLELSVVGKGSIAIENDDLYINSRIHFDNRWIPEKELSNVFSAADIVILPYIEASQSGVVAAAYGMGLPVIVTPVGGLQEQVVHRETGLIASDVTSHALTLAIIELCTDLALYARCCEGALQAGDMENAWQNTSKSMVSIFSEVLELPPLSCLNISQRLFRACFFRHPSGGR
jgi:glycosyltransferase involved in cell wall biosynthesis